MPLNCAKIIRKYKHVRGVFFNMLKIAIFDDEEVIVQYLESLIREFVEEDVRIYKYTEIQNLRKDLKKGLLQELDILYIDIKINRSNGITVAKTMQENNPNLRVVYVTAYSEYSEEIFRTTPTYLLLKPIKKEKLQESLKKAMEERYDKDLIKTFCIKGKVFSVKINNIKYIESNKRVIIIYEKDFKRKIYAKLSDLEKMLPEQFIRCHQSYIVNLGHAKELNSHEFILNTGEKVPVSQAKYRESKNTFIKYLGESI